MKKIILVVLIVMTFTIGCTKTPAIDNIETEEQLEEALQKEYDQDKKLEDEIYGEWYCEEFDTTLYINQDGTFSRHGLNNDDSGQFEITNVYDGKVYIYFEGYGKWGGTYKDGKIVSNPPSSHTYTRK